MIIGSVTSDKHPCGKDCGNRTIGCQVGCIDLFTYRFINNKIETRKRRSRLKPVLTEGHNRSCKAIRVYDEDGYFVREFGSIADCCRWLIDKKGLTCSVGSLRHAIHRTIGNKDLYLNYAYRIIK